MKYDPALINYYDDTELSNILDPLIKEYRTKEDVDICRGQCYNESDKFINWLEKNHNEIFKELDELGMQRYDGLFSIDSPEKLPLEIQDLEQDEYEEFMDLYEDDVDFHNPENVSYYVWLYLQNYADDERINDFFVMNHSWIDIEGMFIIDFTWQQFKNAIINTEDLIDRYEY